MNRREFGEAHATALGHFAGQFAVAETVIHDFLVWKSGIDPKLAPAIFSGTRLSAGIMTIRRIYQAQGRPIEPDVASAFERLQMINGIRNQVMHYGVTYAWDEEDVGPFVSNARLAPAPEKVQETNVTVDDLDRMTTDLTVCAFILELRLLEAQDPLATPGAPAQLDDAWSYRRRLRVRTR